MKDMENKERVIPRKNYIRVFLIYVVVLVVTFIAVYSYDSYQKYQNSISILKDTIVELNVESFENYTLENEDFLLYIGVPSSKESRMVEKDLLSVIKKYQLENKMIYLNVEDNWKSFSQEFNKTYDKKLEKYPAFVIFDNGQVLDLVQKTNQNLTAADIVQLLEEYEMIEG